MRCIIEQTHHSLLTGEAYNPARKTRAIPYPATIEEGSKTEQLVADYLELGLSYTEVTIVINRDLFRARMRSVRRSAVFNCAKRMTHIDVPIEKRPQGSLDPDSDWAMARYRWVTQLLIRLGEEVDLTPFEAEDGRIPDCFNCELLTRIHLGGIVWWDDAEVSAYRGRLPHVE